MTEHNKNSLEIFIYNETGGRYDPLIVKQIIGVLEKWIPEEEECKSPMDFYSQGYNSYRRSILKNLWWKKND